MDLLEDNSCWDFLDYTFIDANTSADFSWPLDHSGALEHDISSTGGAVPRENECSRKRAETKACREKLRSEKLNDRYLSDEVR